MTWRSADYFVDPANCVSGGYIGTGQWRNLPNNVSLAVPKPFEALQKVPHDMTNRLVCGYGKNTTFLLTEYRRHVWSNMPCNHPHVTRVHQAWLHSLPRGAHLNMQMIREDVAGHVNVHGLLAAQPDAKACATDCHQHAQCTAWYHNNSHCLMDDTTSAQIITFYARHWGGYLRPHMYNATYTHAPGAIAVQDVAEEHHAHNSQECCHKCRAYSAWKFATMVCQCFDAPMTGQAQCWTKQLRNGQQCQAQVTAHVTNGAPQGAQFQTARETTLKQCVDLCMQSTLCWMATWNQDLCTLFQPNGDTSATEPIQPFLIRKQGGCVQSGEHCMYDASKLLPGVTKSGACSANGATFSRHATGTLFYSNADQIVLAPVLNTSCSGSAAPLQPRALSPLQNTYLKTVDTNLLLNRIERIQNAWSANGNPLDDGLGGRAFANNPSIKQSYTAAAQSIVEVVPNGVAVSANTNARNLLMSQVVAPVPRNDFRRKACEKQAELASLAVGMGKTSASPQCYSVGRCVPPVEDAGALDNVYNAYVEQLQACMAADYLDSELPVPIALLIQPGTEFVYQAYQDIPVYYHPNSTTTANGYIVRFGPNAGELPPNVPTPNPADTVSPTPFPSTGLHYTTYGDDCTFITYDNTTLAAKATYYLTPISSSAYNVTTRNGCGQTCANLLACRLFVHFDNSCALYSINTVGCLGNQNCDPIWVESAEKQCVVAFDQHFVARKTNATLHVKNNCCIIS